MSSVETLRRYAYFTSGGEEPLRQLAINSTEVDVAVGETLFSDGEEAAALYVITDGEIDIQLTMAGARKAVVDTMVAGDVVGWSAIVEPHTFRADAVARTASHLVAIDAVTLRQLCEDDVRFAHGMLGQVVRSLVHRLEASWVQLAAESPR